MNKNRFQEVGALIYVCVGSMTSVYKWELAEFQRELIFHLLSYYRKNAW